MAEFNYDDDTIADANAVSAVVAQMSNTPAKPLSDSERAELDNFIAECHERERQQRLEFEQEQFALAEAKRLDAEQRAAMARAERTEKLRAEMAEQSRRQMRDRSLTDILNHQIEQRQFRQQALRSQANAASRQRLKSILYPPQPPEPTVVVVQPEDDGSADFGSRNFDVAKWARKPRSWW